MNDRTLSRILPLHAPQSSTFPRARVGAPAWMVLTLAWVLVLAGCISERPQAPGDDEAAAVVEMTGALRFEPEEVTIERGETVRWTNPSSVIHTATGDPSKAADPSNVQLPPGAEPFDSGEVLPGGSYRHTFDVAGRYDYVCLPHEGAGMLGTVIVQ